MNGLSKVYKLGTFGYGSLQRDLVAWWARMRGKVDPNSTIGQKSRFGENGNFRALHDLTFDIAQGDRVAVLGRNGAGKSTLLKILSRITSPTSGVARIRGRVASLLEVGTGFHPELTGRENVFLNGAILGMRRNEIKLKFDEILDFAGIEEFIDTPVKRYSSGMQVKLAFSVAAHLDSEILIADEVLAVGDLEFQRKSLGKMKDVSQEQGKTVIFVTHQLGTLRSLCNRGIVLQDGVLAKSGTLDVCLEYYLDLTKQKTVGLPRVGSAGSPLGHFISIDPLVNGQTSTATVVDVYDKIGFRVQYELNEKLAGAHVVLQCMQEGDVLFTAIDCSENEEILEPRGPKIFTVRIDIQPGFFRIGSHSFNLGLAVWGAQTIQKIENIFPIEVVLHSRNPKFHQATLIQQSKVNAPVSWTQE